MGNLLYGLMLVTVILASLNKLGVNTNSFVAVLGAAGVAIGVSLKDQLSNLAAGVLIVILDHLGVVIWLRLAVNLAQYLILA